MAGNHEFSTQKSFSHLIIQEKKKTLMRSDQVIIMISMYMYMKNYFINIPFFTGWLVTKHNLQKGHLCHPDFHVFQTGQVQSN